MADPKTCLHNVVIKHMGAEEAHCASCFTEIDESMWNKKNYQYDGYYDSWVHIPINNKAYKKA